MVVRLGEGARVIDCREEVVTPEEPRVKESGYFEVNYSRQNNDGSSCAFVSPNPDLKTLIFRKLLLVAEEPPEQIKCNESEESKENKNADNSAAP